MANKTIRLAATIWKANVHSVKKYERNEKYECSYHTVNILHTYTLSEAWHRARLLRATI